MKCNPACKTRNSLDEVMVIIAECKQNQFDSKAGTTAKAIETLMGQYFD